ncbi:MAG: hypothetical protein AAFV51_07370, partial [Pseudomonadota bacterium]
MNPHGRPESEAALKTAFKAAIRYLRDFDRSPVPATASQREILARLPDAVPETGAAAEEVVADLVAEQRMIVRPRHSAVWRNTSPVSTALR